MKDSPYGHPVLCAVPPATLRCDTRAIQPRVPAEGLELSVARRPKTRWPAINSILKFRGPRAAILGQPDGASCIAFAVPASLSLAPAPSRRRLPRPRPPFGGATLFIAAGVAIWNGYLASTVKKSQFSKIQGRFLWLGNPPFILFRNHIWVRLDIAHGQK
jgi:hypothetical protein